jgi:endonuclease III
MPKPLKPNKNALSQTLPQVLSVLDSVYTTHPMGEVCGGDAYKVLVGCIISLRTKDEVTIPACERLFPIASTPSAMLSLTPSQLEQLIYPCGFYKTKALNILEASQVLLDRFNGQVPTTIDELLTLKGVGRKTANLVVGLGHGLPAICVDIHVHRICNRLGVVNTQTPDETEMVLRQGLPQPYWQVINRIMVMHGRDCCKAIGAWCDVCPVRSACAQQGVKPRKPPLATLA